MPVPVIAIKDEHEEGDLFWRLDDATTPDRFIQYMKINVDKNKPVSVYVDDLSDERWADIVKTTIELDG